MRSIKKLLLTFVLSSLVIATMKADENAPITINVKDATIQEILREVEIQSGLNFTYESSVLNGIKKITFQAEKESLKNCLDRLFRDLPVSYVIRGQFIILKRKTQQITISGFVRSKKSDEPLVGASVLDQVSRKGIATNQHGFFSFSIPEGSVSLQVSYIGFQSYKRTYKEVTNDIVIDIFLEEQGQLQEVVVMGSNEARNTVLTPQMGVMKVSQATIKTIPTLFGEADIIKAIQTLPGVSPGTEGLSGLYVRGGNGDENLFLLDGNPLYQVNHLGGLFSGFNTEAISDMEFYKGAFPARFGGRLSSVMDINTKEGDLREYHGSASLGLTSGNIHINGPIKKDQSSFSFSVRRSWFDVLSAPAIAIFNKIDKKNGNKTAARYAFTDMNLRLDHHINPRSHTYFSFYWGDDMFRFGQEEFPAKDSYYYGEESSSDYDFLDKDMNKLRWGNILLSSGWKYSFNSKLNADFSAVFTRYHSKIKMEQYNSYEYTNKDDEKISEESFSESSSDNGIIDIGVKAIFNYTPTPSHHIRYGGTYYHHRYQPEYVRSKYSGDIDVPQNLSSYNILSANEGNFYIEDDWSLSKNIRFNAGLRFSIYEIQKKTYLSLEPRLSARFLINRDVSLKMSYARMNQYVHQLTDSYLSLPTDMWLPVTRNLKPLVSDQVSVGGYYSLNNEYSFSLEGYYKWMNNILDYKDGHNVLPSFLGWENKLAAGKGWSYGVEVIGRREQGRLTGWVGYGLMWADRQFEEINDGKKYPAKYDNRHKINIVANYKLSEKVELTGSWTYMTGNRITLALEEYIEMTKPEYNYQYSGYTNYMWGLEYVEGRNNFRLPDYHRLDLGINIYRPTKKGRMGIWNISIYNVYSRFNPITVKRDSKLVPSTTNSYGDWVPCFKTFGFMPIVPSVSYTLKF